MDSIKEENVKKSMVLCKIYSKIALMLTPNTLHVKQNSRRVEDKPKNHTPQKGLTLENKKSILLLGKNINTAVI